LYVLWLVVPCILLHWLSTLALLPSLILLPCCRSCRRHPIPRSGGGCRWGGVGHVGLGGALRRGRGGVLGCYSINTYIHIYIYIYILKASGYPFGAAIASNLKVLETVGLYTYSRCLPLNLWWLHMVSKAVQGGNWRMLLYMNTYQQGLIIAGEVWLT
jgi:hypothetical protein